ncbi:hypothetical protein GAYE_SCF13G3483 [Galdieria yellowstonensis]|jgi:hypothetical protein|uniref:DUF218 domain-containing protein n=1 Tax=Galdieria yellowstonensis TaxID=3028027 RepID=A0AAV9IDW8_9RHOD|nr:hypothetical protein GAYE_SCF13G3483 [Galdieria yellowstonensis]
MSSSKVWDAVVVLGGGLDTFAQPQPWVKARLERAIQVADKTKYFIVTSRGTPHKPPPLDEHGFPVDESTASARFLIQVGGLHPQRILKDMWSLDTLGNAYFTRFMLCEPLHLSKLLIITNLFHLERTKLVFEKVFTVPSNRSDPIEYCLEFEGVEDRNLNEQQLQARKEKEQEALNKLKLLFLEVDCVEKLSEYMFSSHGAYCAAATSNSQANSLWSSTY